MVQAHFKNEQRQNHEERFEENKWKEPERKNRVGKMACRRKEEHGMKLRRMRNNSRKTEINVQPHLLDDPTYMWKRTKTKKGKKRTKIKLV